MSTIGSGNGQSPTWPRCVSSILPSLIRQMSALVPPISTVMISAMPQAAATSRAPTTPAAGPDRAVSAGARRIVAPPATPPFDCMNKQWRAHLFLDQAILEPRDVGRDAGHDHSVEHRRQRAFVFPNYRQHVGRGGDGNAGQRLAQDLGDPPLVRGIGEGMQQADRDGFNAERATGRRRRLHARARRAARSRCLRRRSAPRLRARATLARDAPA